MDYRGANGWIRLSIDDTGGRAAVRSVAVRGGSGDWKPLANSWGATWEMGSAPAPPLSFKVRSLHPLVLPCAPVCLLATLPAFLPHPRLPSFPCPSLPSFSCPRRLWATTARRWKRPTSSSRTAASATAPLESAPPSPRACSSRFGTPPSRRSVWLLCLLGGRVGGQACQPQPTDPAAQPCCSTCRNPALSTVLPASPAAGASLRRPLQRRPHAHHERHPHRGRHRRQRLLARALLRQAGGALRQALWQARPLHLHRLCLQGLRRRARPRRALVPAAEG